MLTPGPGQHDPKPVLTSSHSAILKTSSAQRPKIALSVGPGQYSPEKPLKQAAKTKIGSTKRPDPFDCIMGSLKSIPGPGEYSTKDSWLTKSVTSIRGPYKAPKNLNPGPGSYDSSSNLYYKQCPRSVIGTQKRPSNFEKQEQVPGPGEYNQPISKGPSYSMVGKPARKDCNGVPGPGSYRTTSVEVGQVKKGSTRGSVSRASRSTSENFEMNTAGKNATTIGHTPTAQKPLVSSVSRASRFGGSTWFPEKK